MKGFHPKPPPPPEPPKNRYIYNGFLRSHSGTVGDEYWCKLREEERKREERKRKWKERLTNWFAQD